MTILFRPTEAFCYDHEDGSGHLQVEEELVKFPPSLHENSGESDLFFLKIVGSEIFQDNYQLRGVTPPPPSLIFYLL